MSELVTQPETGALSGAYAPGVLEQYNTAELDQINKVQYAGQLIDEVQHTFHCEVIRLKQMLDGQDQAEGIEKYNSHHSSRFWDGSRAGHFGEKLKEIANNGQRGTVQRWLTANDAAAKLLGTSVSQDTQDLPLELARKRGMGQTALCNYASMKPAAKAMANHYFTVTGQLRSDMLQECTTMTLNWPNRQEEVCELITQRKLTTPTQFKKQRDAWQKELDIQKALIEEQERQDKLAAAEAEEEKLDNEPEPKDEPAIEPKAEDVTRRKARTPGWFKSDSGLIKTKEVVGDLPKPLADAVTGLNGLRRELRKQVVHCSEMHNYAEFWAGYDRHAMSEAAAQRVWGKEGRLGRMRKLRSTLIEVQQQIDIYIRNTTPPENIEYPED